MSEQEQYTEWRVETEDTEDEFGTDEQEAREWLDRCEKNPDWLPAVLMRRDITVKKTEWTVA